MAIALGGVITVPDWAYGWNQAHVLAASQSVVLPPEMETLLSEVVEAIIPATNTPGAKELGVDKFMLTMLKDCFEKDVQEKFSQGLQAIEERTKKQFGNSFTLSTPAQRHEVLSALDKVGSNSPFSLVKNLTIQGYLNSEYVLKNLLKYELIPARYHGCVPATH